MAKKGSQLTVRTATEIQGGEFVILGYAGRSYQMTLNELKKFIGIIEADGGSVDLTQVSTDILPLADASKDIGSLEKRWKKVYSTALTVKAQSVDEEEVNIHDGGIEGKIGQDVQWSIDGSGKANFYELTVNGADVATMDYVNNELSKILGGASGAYDTLKEIEDILNNDTTGLSALFEEIGTKAGKDDLDKMNQKVSTLEKDKFSADEEDFTTIDNKLKLKDRDTTYGMGYVILRKNKTFTEQLTQTNTIYEIRYGFDLNGETVSIPNDCVLKFKGGSISNGTIVANSAIIYGSPIIDCSIDGYFLDIHRRVFNIGTYNLDDAVICSTQKEFEDALIKAESTEGVKIYLLSGKYYLTIGKTYKKSLHIIGVGDVYITEKNDKYSLSDAVSVEDGYYKCPIKTPIADFSLFVSGEEIIRVSESVDKEYQVNRIAEKIINYLGDDGTLLDTFDLPIVDSLSKFATEFDASGVYGWFDALWSTIKFKVEGTKTVDGINYFTCRRISSTNVKNLNGDIDTYKDSLNYVIYNLEKEDGRIFYDSNYIYIPTKYSEVEVVNNVSDTEYLLSATNSIVIENVKFQNARGVIKFVCGGKNSLEITSCQFTNILNTCIRYGGNGKNSDDPISTIRNSVFTNCAVCNGYSIYSAATNLKDNYKLIIQDCVFTQYRDGVTFYKNASAAVISYYDTLVDNCSFCNIVRAGIYFADGYNKASNCKLYNTTEYNHLRVRNYSRDYGAVYIGYVFDDDTEALNNTQHKAIIDKCRIYNISGKGDTRGIMIDDGRGDVTCTNNVISGTEGYSIDSRNVTKIGSATYTMSGIRNRQEGNLCLTPYKQQYGEGVTGDDIPIVSNITLDNLANVVKEGVDTGGSIVLDNDSVRADGELIVSAIENKEVLDSTQYVVFDSNIKLVTKRSVSLTPTTPIIHIAFDESVLTQDKNVVNFVVQFSKAEYINLRYTLFKYIGATHRGIDVSANFSNLLLCWASAYRTDSTIDIYVSPIVNTSTGAITQNGLILCDDPRIQYTNSYIADSAYTLTSSTTGYIATKVYANSSFSASTCSITNSVFKSRLKHSPSLRKYLKFDDGSKYLMCRYGLFKCIGTTEERPSFESWYSSKMNGFGYYDTTIKKTIWYDASLNSWRTFVEQGSSIDLLSVTSLYSEIIRLQKELVYQRGSSNLWSIINSQPDGTNDYPTFTKDIYVRSDSNYERVLTTADKATTLEGYGITDAKIDGNTVILGEQTINVPSSLSDLDGIDELVTKTTIPKAGHLFYGGIKTGYEESGKNYAVKLDEDGKAYVNVPWIDYDMTKFVEKNGSVDSLSITSLNTEYIRTQGDYIRMSGSSELWSLINGQGSDNGNYPTFTKDIYLRDGSNYYKILTEADGLFSDYLKKDEKAASALIFGTGTWQNSLLTTSLSTGMVSYGLINSSGAGSLPTSGNANGVLTLNTHTGDYHHQLAFCSSGVYHRVLSNKPLDTDTAWNKLAFVENTVAKDDNGDVAISGVLTVGTLDVASKINSHTEGINNLVEAVEQFDIFLGELTTNNVAEGSNLYFTNQRAIDATNGVYLPISSVYSSAVAPTVITPSGSNKSKYYRIQKISDGSLVVDVPWEAGTIDAYTKQEIDNKLALTATSVSVVALTTRVSALETAGFVDDSYMRNYYSGSTKISTVGTITTGTWNGSRISNEYLEKSTITVAGQEIPLGGEAPADNLKEPLGITALSSTVNNHREIINNLDTRIGNVENSYVTSDAINGLASQDDLDALGQVVSAHTLTINGHTESIASLIDQVSDISSSLSNKADKATTLAGYGITDAKISSGKIILGSNSITPLTSSSTLSSSKLDNSSITIAGSSVSLGGSINADTLKSSLGVTDYLLKAGGTSTEALTSKTTGTSGVALNVYSANTASVAIRLRNKSSNTWLISQGGTKLYITDASWSNNYEILHTYNMGNHVVTKDSSGNASIAGTLTCSAVVQTSDVTKKDVVDDCSLTISQIAEAPSFKFTWKYGNDDVHVGTSAQYWKNVLPEVVRGEEGNMSLDYATLGVVSSIILARNIETHEQRIARLEKEKMEMKAEAVALKAEIVALKAVIENLKQSA